MKKIKFLSLIFTLLLAVLAVSVVQAQEPEQTDNQNQVNRPFRLLQELGLTREQIQQIRRINQERRPIMQDAQRRWRMANRDLDLAIYADDSTEEEVKELLKAAQLAHAELLKERTLTEYLIRKVLTPEQLVKFRELREMLMQRNQRRNRNVQNNPDDQQPQRPVNRLQQRRNQRRGQ
jgi:Spy/CpxP family protein refolding chaperone